LPTPYTTVVIPTLAGGSLLSECLASLERQTRRDFEIVVVDNGGKGTVKGQVASGNVRVIENSVNAGYGGAVNQAAATSGATYLAVLNDDTTLDPEWMEAMVETADGDPQIGMCAAKVLLAKEGTIDSAGMLLCPDGSSKQQGHGRPAETFGEVEEVLLPSGSAALYRRSMFVELGGFDASFFLYCEDTDLGLRARRAGWKCMFVPQAVVQHHYSSTAGRVSPLKAYYVERNRLFVVLKNYPLRMLWRVLPATIARYYWHLRLMREGKGAAAAFREQGHSAFQMVSLVVRAHLAVLVHGWRLWRGRREIARHAKLSAAEFEQVCRRFAISPEQVAAQ
jgi:GT2 family glycosyltransferase